MIDYNYFLLLLIYLNKYYNWRLDEFGRLKLHAYKDARTFNDTYIIILKLFNTRYIKDNCIFSSRLVAITNLIELVSWLINITKA